MKGTRVPRHELGPSVTRHKNGVPGKGKTLLNCSRKASSLIAARVERSLRRGNSEQLIAL